MMTDRDIDQWAGRGCWQESATQLSTMPAGSAIAEYRETTR